MTRQPRQGRAQQTVARILDATGQLLAAKGYAGLNTNAVADLAGVNISTLYSYFPNKEALLTSLLEQFQEAYMREVVEELQRNPDKNQRTANILDAQLSMLINRPWMSALFQAMNASPDLLALKRQANQQMVDLIKVRISPALGRPSAPDEQLDGVLLLLVEMISHGLRVVMDSEEALQPLLMSELKRMINRYLDDYR